MSNSGWTNRGEKLALDSHFRGQNIPSSFKIVLVTDAVVPSATTSVASDLVEIAIGNGYTAGGYVLNRNSTDFDVVTEDDSGDLANVQVKNVVFTASGGSIPASGDGASYAILADNNDNVWYYWWLRAAITVTSGYDITLADLELRGLSAGGEHGFTNRGIYGLLRDVFQNLGALSSLALVLATSTNLPTEDSNVLSDIDEIPSGNGYPSGGYVLNRDGTDFPMLTDGDAAGRVALSIKDITFTASGGPIPATGTAVAYIGLRSGTNNLLVYWTLDTPRTISDGQIFSLLGLTFGLREVA